MRKVVLFGVLAAAMATVSGASAAGAASGDMNGMAEKGHLYVSADRVFGVSWSQLSVEQSRTVGNTTITTSDKYGATTVGLLWSNTSLGNGVPVVYLMPRVGVDFTVINNLTIGGNLGYTHSSGSRDNNNGNVTTTIDQGTQSGFLLAPRVGYVLGLGPSIGLWLRGGVTYYNVGASSAPRNNGTDIDTVTLSGLALNLDPQFVITPVEHFFFTAGLAVDIPMTGSYENKNVNGSVTTTESIDHYKFTNIGLTFGIGGYL